MDTYKVININPSIVLVQTSQIGNRLDAGNYRQDYIKNRELIRKSTSGSKKLGDLLKQPSFRGKGLPINDSGTIPVIKVRNITDIGITGPYDNTDLINVSSSDRAWVKFDDVLLTVSGLGSSGKADLFWFDEPMLADGHIAILRCTGALDNGYLKAFLSSPYGKKLSDQDTIGSTGQIELYGDYIDNFDIPYPDPKIQAYIGDKVRLAEKCREEANRLYETSKIILTDQIGLENISSTFQEVSSQAIYMHNGSFAVQIEPRIVTDRLDAQGYNPELLSILSKLGQAKCKFVTLDNLGHFSPASQGTINGESSDYFVSILHVDDKGVIDWQEAKRHKPITRGSRVLYNDILISKLNPKEKRIGVFDCKGSARAGCSSEFSLFKAKKYPYYLAFVLSSHPTHQQLVSLGRGTSSSRRRIDERDLKNVFVPIVNDDRLIDEYIHQAVLLWQKSRELVFQAIRDIEHLIEGNLETSAILSGSLHSQNWEEILNEINHHG